MSDNESEDGEEGDYTVYECPGLAPVSNREKNPKNYCKKFREINIYCMNFEFQTGTILEVKPTLTTEELMKLMQMQSKTRPQEEKSCSKTSFKSNTKKLNATNFALKF